MTLHKKILFMKDKVQKWIERYSKMIIRKLILMVFAEEKKFNSSINNQQKVETQKFIKNIRFEEENEENSSFLNDIKIYLVDKNAEKNSPNIKNSNFNNIININSNQIKYI